MRYSLKHLLYEDLTAELRNFIDVVKKLETDTTDDYDKLNREIESIVNEAKTLLSSSISPNAKIFHDIIDEQTLDYFGSRYDIHHSRNRKPEGIRYNIDQIIKNAELVLDYLGITDSLIDINQKRITSIQEKKDFALEKLLSVFNDKYYDLSLIFSLNDISCRSDEPKEIADDLDKREYLTRKHKYGNDSFVKLTVKGASYIERKINSKIKKINSEKSDGKLYSRIDEVIKMLEKLGIGQEVIFNEFEELKNLAPKISKKSWGQLLTGKLIDLTISNIITKENANTIFKFLTNEDLKFLE